MRTLFRPRALSATPRLAGPLAALLVAGLVGAGCGDPAADGPRALAGPSEILAVYGPCASPPTATAQAPASAELPDGTVVTSADAAGPVTRVEGYLPATPLDARAELEGRDDLAVLQIEDEIVETEALVSNGTHRTYVQVIAVCDRGSRVVAIVAAEADAGDLPRPAGSPPAPTP